MTGTAVIGLDITDADLVAPGQSPAFTVGARGSVDSLNVGGVREFMYVQFALSAAVAIGNALAINSITGIATRLNNTNGAAGQTVGRRIGVAMFAVSSSATPQFGWVQIYGPGLVTATAAVAVNTNLTTTAVDGHLGAGGSACSGVVLTAVGAGATPSACTLNYPFVTA
jgi:hypothetical protein